MGGGAALPQRVGRCVVQGVLGRGGMGLVLRGWDPGLQRAVAIKVLDGAGPLDERRVARFAREATAAARLRHPGIVSVHEVGADDGRPFIIMDLVEGESLEGRLARAPMPPRDAAAVVAQVARALEHAHEHGIIHRDVKPENILLDPDGRAVLTDFGLAREVDASAAAERLTASGQLMGTPAYMAPEQAGAGGEVGPASDVYGAGAVLFRALAGRPPFDEPELMPLLRRVLAEEAPPLRRLEPSVHPDLETIVARCLEKVPARRYASAGALAADLDRFVGGEVILARPVGRVRRAVRWARRRPLAAAGIGALALALAVAAGVVVATRVELRRRLAAERASFVESARREAERAASDFARAREQRAATATTTASADRDRLITAGLDAVAAAMTLHGLAPEDEAARASAFETALGCAEVAIDLEAWSVATGAAEKALALGEDDARARAALARVEQARRESAERDRAAVVAVLDDARSGRVRARPDGYEDALFALVRRPGPQAVALLAAALDEVSDALAQATRALLLEAAEPTADEARAGERPIDGLGVAVDAWLGRGPRDPVAEPVAARVRAAATRIERRHAVANQAASYDRLLATRQRTRLESEGQDLTTLARLCSDALGRIGRVEGAGEALARYVALEADELRAVPAASALWRLGDEPTRAWLLTLGRARDPNGPLMARIGRLAEHTGGAAAAGRIAAPADDARALMRRAIVRRTAGDLEGATADLDRAIELAPWWSAPWSNRANARMAAGDLDGAIDDLDRAIELDPRDAHALLARGQALALRGDPERALADLDRALALDPDEAAAWNNRATVRRTLGDLEGARADLDRAIVLDPRRGVFFAGRARVRLSMGDARGSLADARQAVELDPGYALGWIRLAQAQEALGALDEGVAALERALAVEPDDAEALMVRGRLQVGRGDREAAVADWSRVIELQPDNARAWANRGTARMELGRLEQARADLDRALALDPTEGANWAMRSLVRREEGDLAGALSDAERAVAAAPRAAATLSARGNARLDLGQPEAAAADFARWVELQPGNPRAWANLGRARGDLDDLAGAIDAYGRAIRIAPDMAGLWSNRAAVRLRAGDAAGSLADARRATELAPGLAPAWTNLGMAHAAREEPELAIAAFGRAIAIAPRQVVPWRERARARARAGDRAGARTDYERCLELVDPAGPLGVEIVTELAALERD